MEGQVNDAPRCDLKHMLAQLTPYADPGLFLNLRILSLLVRSLALNVDLHVIDFDKQIR
ncbi:hypothetical protein D3C71_1709660 [compost metagenome]